MEIRIPDAEKKKGDGGRGHRQDCRVAPKSMAGKNLSCGGSRSASPAYRPDRTRDRRGSSTVWRMRSIPGGVTSQVIPAETHSCLLQQPCGNAHPGRSRRYGRIPSIQNTMRRQQSSRMACICCPKRLYLLNAGPGGDPNGRKIVEAKQKSGASPSAIAINLTTGNKCCFDALMRCTPYSPLRSSNKESRRRR